MARAYRQLCFVALLLLVAALAPAARPALALSLTVDTASDGADSNIADGICRSATAGDRCTLRAAIETVNASGSSGPHAISFAIPQTPAAVGGGPGYEPEGYWRIQLSNTLRELPAITSGGVTIDGSTQPAGSGAGASWTHPRIVLDGRLVTSGDGLMLTSAGNTIRRLTIHGFPGTGTTDGAGIRISGAGATGNVVEGCYIGTSPDGSSAVPNRQSGVAILNASNNRIGSATASWPPSTTTGNLVAGNGTAASGAGLGNIYIVGDSSTQIASGNIIRGNLVGSTASGLAEISGGNPGDGIILRSVVHDTTIENNLIVGSNDTSVSTITRSGIYLLSSFTGLTSRPLRTLIYGNRIGTRIDGVGPAIPNSQGIRVASGNTTTIGGASAAQRNIISGNGPGSGSDPGAGVNVRSNTTISTTIRGNWIGLGSDGQPLATVGDGVRVELNAAATTIRENYVAASSLDGIRIDTDGTTVAGNLIGVNTATPPRTTTGFANSGSGVAIIGRASSGTAGNTIGGAAPGDGNIISVGSSGALRAGVLIQPNTTSLLDNVVQGNFIGVDQSGASLGGASANAAGVFVVGKSSSVRADNTRIEGNTIGGLDHGIRVGSNTTSYSTGNVIRGNQIGTGTGTIAQFGIWLYQSSGNTIGGNDSATRNEIASATNGIFLDTGSGSNTLLRNLLRNNNGNGIRVNSGLSLVRISGSETTSNSLAGIDLVSGANGGIQPPTLSTFTPGATPTVRATTTASCSGPGGCTVEIFTSPTREDGEGPRFLITQANVAANTPVDIPVAGCDRYLAATVTDSAGNTSAFTATMLDTGLPGGCQSDITLTQTGRSPPGSGAVAPGTTVTYTYTVANSGAVGATVNLSRVDVSGWAGLPTPASLSVPAGESRTFDIVVVVPANATAGPRTMTVTAQAGSQTRTVDTTTTVSRTYGVTLVSQTPTQIYSTTPTTVDFVHTVGNTGNDGDTINLTAAVVGGATASFLAGGTTPCSLSAGPPASVSLAAFASCTLVVRLNIPSGPAHTVTVTAASAGSPTTTAQAVSTATAGAAPILTPPSQTKDALPGATLTFTHTLRNASAAASGTFTPDLSSAPAGWSFSLQPAEGVGFALGPNATRVLTITVVVPSSPAPDAESLTTATLTVAESGGATASATSTTRVLLDPDFDFSAATQPSVSAAPGATAVFTHTLTNLGNGPDSFSVSATALDGGLTVLSVTPSNPIGLLRGGSTPVVVRVRVTDGQAAGPQRVSVAAQRAAGGAAISYNDTVNVPITAGVRLSPAQSKSVTPPGVVSFTHTLTNTGNTSGNFSVGAVVVGAPAGWSVDPVSAPCLTGLGNGLSCSFTVTVRVPGPPQAPARPFQVLVTATTAGASDSVTDIVNVNPVAGLSFTRNESASGAPDATITFTHRLTNTGNITDSYSFAVELPPGGFSVTPPASLAEVPAGSARDVTLQVQLPGAAPAGTSGVITLTASSALSPTLKRSVSDTVTVLERDNARLVPTNPTEQTIFTGGGEATASYTLDLFNSGNTTISYTLRLSAPGLPPGWSATLAPTQTSVLAPSLLNAIPLSVQVTAPADATGVQGVVVEVLRGGTAGPVLATATLTTTALQAPTSGLLEPLENRGFAFPGETVVYTHTVTNILPQDTTFVFSTLTSLGYQVTEPPSIFLRAGASQEVAIAVSVPTGVMSGTVGATLLTVRAASNPDISASAVEYTTVRQVVGSVLSPAYVDLIEPGELVTFEHQLQNTGNYTDTFALSAASDEGWPIVSVTPNTTRLAADGRELFIEVVVQVPPGVEPGSVDRIVVRAESASDPFQASTTENLLAYPAQQVVPDGRSWLYLPIVRR